MRKFAIGISSVVCLVAVFASSRVSNREPEMQRPAHVSSVAAKTSVQKPAAKVAAQYGRTPLAFEENRGQASPEAKFLARGAGYEIFLTPEESVFVLQAPASVNASKIKSPKFASNFRASILRMKLLGANLDRK